MSDLVTVSLISAIGVAFPSIVSAVMSYLTQRLVHKIEANTNGLNDKLLKLTAQKSHAEGVQAERDRQNDA